MGGCWGGGVGGVLAPSHPAPALPPPGESGGSLFLERRHRFIQVRGGGGPNPGGPRCRDPQSRTPGTPRLGGRGPPCPEAWVHACPTGGGGELGHLRPVPAGTAHGWGGPASTPGPPRTPTPRFPHQPLPRPAVAAPAPGGGPRLRPPALTPTLVVTPTPTIKLVPPPSPAVSFLPGRRGAASSRQGPPHGLAGCRRVGVGRCTQVPGSSGGGGNPALPPPPPNIWVPYWGGWSRGSRSSGWDPR